MNSFDHQCAGRPLVGRRFDRVLRMGLLFFGLAGCLSAPDDPQSAIDGAPASGWLTSWTARKPLVVSGSPALLGDAVGFRLPVRLDDADVAAAAQSDGADLRFTGPDGETPLPFELVTYEPEGAIEAWVALDVFPAAGTTIYLYYGNPSAEPASSPAETWPEPYRGVWHLTADPIDPRIYPDSSARSHIGTAPQALESTDGVSGKALSLAGTLEQRVLIGDPASLDFGAGSFSYSLWVRADQPLGEYDMPWYKGGASSSQPGYDIELGTGGWAVHLSDGSFKVQAGAGSQETLGGSSWRHIAVVVDRDANELHSYVDGSSPTIVELPTGFGSVDNSYSAVIGGPDERLFRGDIDEVRVLSGVRDPADIAAEAVFLRNPDLVRAGPEVTAP